MISEKTIVAGGAGGIGRSTAAAMAELGADVALVDIRLDKAQENADEIAKRFGTKVIAVKCDVTKPDEVNAMIETVVRELGGLDCVHSNAGIVANDDTVDMPFESWNRMVPVNFTGMFLVDQAAAVSLLTLVVRIFDAFNDPIIGSIADRTKSRWGRYRPWFMVGSIVMAILIVLQFACNPNWSMTLRLVWMWVIYVLLTVASTCSNMPYGAMKACITPDATDHAKTGGLRMMFANVASMLTLIIEVPLITSLGDGPATSARGFFLAALNYVANTQQTPQVLNAIDLTISVIPCAICVVNAILYLFYPISQKKHKEIMDELIRRRTVTN